MGNSLRDGSSRREGSRSEGLHTYRCPVCGHTDGASLGASPLLVIECSHCGTPLELTLRSEDEERLSVQVHRESPET